MAKNRGGSTKISGPETDEEAQTLMEEAATVVIAEQVAEAAAEKLADDLSSEPVQDFGKCPRCGMDITKPFVGNDMVTICAICKTKELGPGTAIVAKPKPTAAPKPERKPITIDPGSPWAGWPEPDVLLTKLHGLSVDVNAEEKIVLKGENEDVLGTTNTNALRQLGWHTQFPVEFVEKLSPATKVAVINERIAASRDRDITVVFENGEFANLVPSRRGIAPYREVAQTAFDTLKNVYGDQVQLDRADQKAGSMHLRLLTEVREKVTAKKGDELQMGIEINQDYGLGINLALYVVRLACINGMTAERREFEWRSPQTVSIEHQLAWMVTGISTVVDSFQRLVDKSREMAEQPITGDPRKVLEEYARSMRFPRRYFGRLVDAFNAEPEMTQWGLLNAFTRVSTHALSGTAQQAYQDASGRWVRDFDMVSCRMPRPVAVNLGAEILETAA